MSVQSYLYTRANNAILSDAEKASINTSISTLQDRLDSYFEDELIEHFRFGSSTRGTILPRYMDSNSDIDYMIVFANEKYRPQTYIDQLKRFAENSYSSSDIKQSNPSVILKLNHIHFDLVPAINGIFRGYRIPGKASGYQDWLPTEPNDFNSKLTDKNKRYDSKIKPTIRLLKYWNALADYVWDSYDLEKGVLSLGFHSNTTVRDYFFDCIEALPSAFLSPTSKSKVDRAKRIVRNTKDYEKQGQLFAAEEEIKKLIPDI